MRDRSFRVGLAIALVALIAVGAGCGGRQDEGVVDRLETVEVGPAVDVELSTEFDEQAEPDAPEVAGVLPTDFPTDFPLYAPSSLIDYGEAADGLRFLEFDAPADCQEVSRWLVSELAAAGWRGQGSQQEAAGVFTKGERHAELHTISRSPGCGIRIEYGR